MNDTAQELLEKIRAEKDPLKKARLLTYLHSHEKIPVKEIGKEVGMTSAYVSSHFRLVALPEMVMDGYYSGIITLTHLFMISRLTSKEDMKISYEKILKKSLSTSQTEELIREIKFQLSSDGTRLKDDEIKKIIDFFKMCDTNFQVSVKQTRIKSTLRIELRGSTKNTSESLRNFLRKIDTNSLRK